MSIKPTAKEKAWLAKLQKVLSECPSERLGGFIAGNANVVLYDAGFLKSIHHLNDTRNMDFGLAVDQLGCRLGEVTFPFTVDSVVD